MPDRVEADLPPTEYALPASFAQRRLWMLHQLDPASTAYNMPLALWLDGPLDAERLHAALQRVTNRHETLRTRFGMEAGEPVQIVAETAAVRVSHRHARDDAAALALARHAAAEPFALAAGPLWHVLLVAVREDRHLLLINLHHSICDGWSIGLLADEFSQFYANAAAGLPELPLQYADYAAWQADQLSGPAGATLIERCRRRLETAPQTLDLPIDRRRPPVRSGAGGSVQFQLPAARLHQLALTHGATPMMVHAAIFAILLGRWCDRSRVVLGVPVAGRDRAETEPLIGLFVNVLLLPCDLRGDPGFGELLGRVRETMLAALADQALPFERLVEAVQPARNIGQNPLFQVLFSFNNLPPAQAEFAGLRVTPAELGPAAPQFDLSASLTEESGTVLVRLDYDAALFEHATISNLSERWQRLAASVAAESARPIEAYPLTTAAEAAQLAVTPEPAAIPAWCVHEAILARARREPARVFVTVADGSLDGAALTAAIEAVAERLAACGIGRGDRVGVYLRRGTRLVVGLLGVLAAGAAYVPLDPLYPRARIREILAGAGARGVLTERALAADLVGQKLVVLDDPGPTAPVTARVGPDDLAYVIFTSGSTGAPKGVAVGHRALTNLLAAMARAPGCGPADTWLATTTVSFDIAALELFLPLLSGATLAIAEAATVADGEALAAAIERHAATIMQATPSGWRLLLAAGWRGRPGLRALSGGEALPGDLAAALAERTDELWNLYGPTETTIWSAAGPACTDSAEIMPIGAPVANTRITIVDRRMRLLPVGMVGEICIAGAGLAHGYFGRPELTAERFTADPFGPPGGRLYRTGDLGRRRGDGGIDFLGRNDQQLKLHGYRIEPAEIEAALRLVDGIADAVVALRGVGERAELVAWVACPDRKPDPATLRSALAAGLPRYMLPAHFVFLPALPLTPNGKLDRARLPAPESGAGETATAPRSQAEAAMLTLWQEVLGRRDFGVDDDFFSLGGHSLLAVRLVATIRERLGAKLGVRELFLHPTVADLAAVLAAPPAEQAGVLVPLATGGPGLPLLIVPGAGGSPVYLRALAAALAADRAVWGFEAIGSDGSRAPLDSVEAMARAYLAAARAQGLGPPWLLAGHSFGSRVAFEMARQAEALGEEVHGLAVFDTVAPILDSNPFASLAADEARLMAEVAGAVEVSLGRAPSLDPAAFARLSVAERLERVSECLRAAGWHSGEAAVRGLCNVYRAALQTHYRAPGAIAAPLWLAKAATSLMMAGDAPMPALAALANSPLWGWDRLVQRQRISLVAADGDHISMLAGDRVACLARELRAWLDRRAFKQRELCVHAQISQAKV